MSPHADQRSVETGDGHRFDLLGVVPQAPRASLLWLPALGVAARHYLPFAHALADQGVAVWLHEMRGHGSSSLRAGHGTDWGWQQVLDIDLPASRAAIPGGGPQIVGGHSLGGQLACCHAAQAPDGLDALWLVASGIPYWRCFPGPRGWLLPLAYRFLPWLARRRGALPGRAIGFGGNEAPGLIADWARVGLSGRYAAHTAQGPLEEALHALALPAHAVLLREDWLAPPASLAGLVGKLASAPSPPRVLDAAALGARADHFAWMKHPQAVAQALAAYLPG